MLLWILITIYALKIFLPPQYPELAWPILFVGFGILFSLAQAWRYTFAFIIFMIGVFSFGTKGKKWLPRIIIYSSRG